MAGHSFFPEKYFCIDVECVSTGPRHDDHAVALIAVVDQNETVVLKKKIKPKREVFSYLTPLTGLREGDLDGGVSFENAVKEVKSLLGPDVVLIGQRIDCDIKWLELQKGIDYHSYVDLCQIFKVYNPRYKNHTYYPLSHKANVLLQRGMIGEEHSAETDAIASIRLFKRYYNQPILLEEAKRQLKSTPVAPSWKKRNNYQWEGVCLSGFNPKTCTCGAPTLKTGD